MDIELEIGAVVLEGFDAVDRWRFVGALESALRDQLAPIDVDAARPRHARISSEVDEIREEDGIAGAAIGRQVAGIVTRRLHDGGLR